MDKKPTAFFIIATPIACKNVPQESPAPSNKPASEEEKLKLRRMRNSESAYNYRQRIRHELLGLHEGNAELEKGIAELTDKNDKLEEAYVSIFRGPS